MKPDFQKCIKAITTEKAYKTHADIVVVQFNSTKTCGSFSYAPRYSELNAIISLLIKKYGKESVLHELTFGLKSIGKLSENEKKNICKLFKTGVEFKTIAQKFGCSRHTIRNVLIAEFGDYKKFAKKGRTISEEEKIEICKLFKDGDSLRRLSRKFNTTTCKKILIERLSKEKYQEIAKEHQKIGHQKTNTLQEKPFSEVEKVEICQLFLKNIRIVEIGKKFKCSWGPIKKILIPRIGFALYNEITRERKRKASQKNIKKASKASANLPKTEKQVIQWKNWQKSGQEASAKGVWKSSWEDKFYELLKSQNPHLTIKRQYYLKGLNHAYDLAIPELHLLIEIDGDYWHGHSGNKEIDAKRSKRDIEVDKFAKDNGWTVIRINDKILKKLGII